MTMYLLNSHLGILQPTSSFKPYILLSRNLMEGFRQHGDSEIAIIIPFAYQRLPNPKQPFWNSSTNILQTIYPLEQKFDLRQQTVRLHRKAEIIPIRFQRGSSIKQPSWNSSTQIFFQNVCPHEQKLDWIGQAKN